VVEFAEFGVVRFPIHAGDGVGGSFEISELGVGAPPPGARQGLRRVVECFERVCLAHPGVQFSNSGHFRLLLASYSELDFCVMRTVSGVRVVQEGNL